MDERKDVQGSDLPQYELRDVADHPKLGAQIYITDSGRVFVYQTIKVIKDNQAKYVKSGKFEVIKSLTPNLLWQAVMECLKYGQDWSTVQNLNGN